MNKKARFTFWDFLLWFGIFLILLWAVLKSLGIINTPVWLEMLPYYGIGVSAIGAAYKIGRMMEGINATNRKVNHLLQIGKRFDEVEKNQTMCMEGNLKGSPYKKK